MTNAPQTDDGFALVEVIVAFAILAGALIITFQIFQDGLRRSLEAEALAHRITIAREIVSDAERDRDLRTGQRDGTADGLAWRMSVAEIAAAGPPAQSPWRLLKLSVWVAPEKIESASPAILETIIIAGQATP